MKARTWQGDDGRNQIQAKIVFVFTDTGLVGDVLNR